MVRRLLRDQIRVSMSESKGINTHVLKLQIQAKRSIWPHTASSAADRAPVALWPWPRNRKHPVARSSDSKTNIAEHSKP